MNDYECKSFEPLGKGASGITYLVTKKDSPNETYVLKIQSIKQYQERKRALFEKYLLEKIEHPNIIKIYATFQNSEYLLEILEYAVYGDVISFMEKNPDHFADQKMVLTFLRQILSGLQYLHQLGYVHGDLKLQNIVMIEGKIAKLIDFDMTLKIGTNAPQRGTLITMAPEILFLDQVSITYIESMDIYSIGVITYMILAKGNYVFEGVTTINDLLYRVLQGDYKIPSQTRPEIAFMINRCLIADPKDRISIERLIIYNEMALENKNPTYTQHDLSLTNKVLSAKKEFLELVKSYNEYVKQKYKPELRDNVFDTVAKEEDDSTNAFSRPNTLFYKSIDYMRYIVGVCLMVITGILILAQCFGHRIKQDMQIAQTESRNNPIINLGQGGEITTGSAQANVIGNQAWNYNR